MKDHSRLHNNKKILALHRKKSQASLRAVLIILCIKSTLVYHNTEKYSKSDLELFQCKVNKTNPPPKAQLGSQQAV
jgi:hypothetical protein